MITSQQERAFYDQHYARFLNFPDHALRVDRKVLEGNIDDPSQPFYERRRLYRAAMLALDSLRPEGKKILDYGCGPGDFGLWLATEGGNVTLLDLSPAAIELGLKRAKASGVEVRGIAADASRLEMFSAREFDIVFACAALHHTLKYPGAIEELARIMTPGGQLVLCETWSGNPLLSAARKLRSVLAGEAEEQGEEIILSWRELRSLDPFFAEVRVETLNLLAMGKRLFRGRFKSYWIRELIHLAESIDSALLAAAPPLRNWCGEAVITAHRRQSAHDERADALDGIL